MGPCSGALRVSVALLGTVLIGDTDQGTVYSWGCGLNGRLGNGSAADALTPQHVVLSDPAQPAIELACGYHHTLALDGILCSVACLSSPSALGRTFSWGGNDKGQLGVGDLKTRYRPVQVFMDENGQEVCRLRFPI